MLLFGWSEVLWLQLRVESGYIFQASPITLQKFVYILHYKLTFIRRFNPRRIYLDNMILLELENRILADTLACKFESDRLTFIDTTIADFDGVWYRVFNPEKDKTVIVIAIKLACYAELQAHGADERLWLEYGDQFVVPPEGYNIALQYSLDPVPPNYEEIVKKVSLLKRNCFAAVYEKFFEAQRAGVKHERAVIHYRENETLYIEAKEDRVTVIFSTEFRDQSDVAYGKIFMQEFKEGRRASSTAPQVLFCHGEPPKELEGTDARRGEKVGYITFVLEPRHTIKNKTWDTSINMMFTFRNYLHYHIKCTKAYMHQRMRAKTSDFLKVLNRARPQEKERDRSTAYSIKKEALPEEDDDEEVDF